jgi:CMP-N,N'-diacetyllegionaminic acid synthase
MNILFTICGRAGSKGIKGKNVRDFVGKPLVLYTLSVIDLYIQSQSEDNCDVSLNTDSKKLQAIICNSAFYKSLRVSMVERKDDLAGDRVSKMAVILDTLEQMEMKKGKKYDMVVDLDITSPFRRVRDVEDLITKKKTSDCDVVFSVTNSRRNPYFNMVRKTQSGYTQVINSDFVSRQEAPVIYDLNASLYAYSPDFLRNSNHVLEGHSDIIVMYDTGVLDLDRPEDFELMEVIGRWLFENKVEFKAIREHIR